MSKPFSELTQFGIESVEIDMIGCRSCKVVYDGNTYAEWHNRQDPENKYFYSFSGKIVGQDENFEEIVQIGRFGGTYIDGGALYFDGEYTFFDACDMIDQTMCNFAEAIINKNGMLSAKISHGLDRIVHFDRIYIEPKYRGYGIGKYIINNLHSLFVHYLNFEFDIIILEPVPQETNEKGGVSEYNGDDFEEKKRILVKYYKSLGFKFIGKTKYMIKKIDTDY